MLELKGSSRNVFLVLPFQFERMREQKHDEPCVSHLFLPTVVRAQVHLPLTDAEIVARRGEPPCLSSNSRMLYLSLSLHFLFIGVISVKLHLHVLFLQLQLFPLYYSSS